MSNRYGVEQDTKVTPAGNDYIVIADSEDLDSGIPKTKRSLLSSIWASIFGSRDSNDIPEGSTNLYYTTARANLKANDSEVIHNTGDETGISGNKTFTGDITANAFIGDGANITGVTSEINSLIEEANIINGDEFIYYNGSNNVKIDYEDLKNDINANNYLVIPGNANTYLTANTQKATASTTAFKLKELIINRNGHFTISFDLRSNGGGTAYAQIYKNGIAYDVERSESGTSNINQTVNLYFGYGDILEIYARQTGGTLAYVSNLQVTYDTLALISGVPAGVVVIN